MNMTLVLHCVQFGGTPNSPAKQHPCSGSRAQAREPACTAGGRQQHRKACPAHCWMPSCFQSAFTTSASLQQFLRTGIAPHSYQLSVLFDSQFCCLGDTHYLTLICRLDINELGCFLICWLLFVFPLLDYVPCVHCFTLCTCLSDSDWVWGVHCPFWIPIACYLYQWRIPSPRL